MPYFYFIKNIQLDTVSARKSAQWPPVGGEVNPVLWKKEITEQEFKRKLASLELKYREQAKASLT